MSSQSRTRRGLLSVAVCAGLMCWLAVPDAQAAAASTVRIDQLQGEAEILLPGNPRWTLTQTNQTLQPLDRLRTKANSRVTLRWSDQSVATFKELTEIEILPRHAPDAVSGLHLVRGIFSFLHRDKPGRIRVITRGAVAGVEGTEFVIEVAGADDAERTTLSLLDGRVRFGNDQGELVLTNGQQAVAAVGVKPILTAGFIANNVLQWCFYYPAVLDPTDLPLSREERQILRESLAAYASGDLLAALAGYPDGRQPASEAERVYLAALFLAVGQVGKTETVLAALPAGRPSDRHQRLATALRQLISAVKRQPNPAAQDLQLPSELLAASYYEQSRAIGEDSLRTALELARRAAVESPQFSFAWARVAELEFSFGRTGAALEAVEKSLALAPRNAQALALKGFLLAGRNQTRKAIDWFNRAIVADSALGNAWLGRGLCRIRRGDARGGREDLLVAAALEPQRALLRSYLGKAYGDAGDQTRARHELDRAKHLDPSDPTAWLYSALLNEQYNRINEGIRDLERSRELNDNRLLHRSRFLLDEDRAVRGDNLARLYRDMGLGDVAAREAGRAVAADYGNYSAHLFLANSFDAIKNRDVSGPRFDTPRFSEYFIARLLGPPEGRLQIGSSGFQEYTRLLDRDGLGLLSQTDYLSRGAWNQYAAQYGTFNNSGYALEALYRTDPGETPNRDTELRLFTAKFKQQITERDGLLVDVLHFRQEFEDPTDHYDPANAVPGYHGRDKQEPSLLAGWDHRWENGQRTLVLASHLGNSRVIRNPRAGTILLPDDGLGNVEAVVPVDLTQAYRNRLTVESLELQHIDRRASLQTIAGVRLQAATARIGGEQVINNGNASGLEVYFGPQGTVVTDQSSDRHAWRVSPYLYEHWQVLDSLMLIGGVTYDYLSLPRNAFYAPVGDGDERKSRLSPKAAALWTPSSQSILRAAYSRSLGGFDLDQSVRLEPTQLGGFVQGYRTLFPPSLVGEVSGTPMETADLAWEWRFPARTYVALSGQFLRSKVAHDVGAFQRDIVAAGVDRQIRESLRFQERSLELSVQQLLADWFSAGVRYRISEARLSRAYPEFDPSICLGCGTDDGTLQVVAAHGRFQHPAGFFAGAEGQWWSQDLEANLRGLAGDSFWQFNLFTGYRSPHRRVEVTLGLLNVTDQDYRLHPVNVRGALSRERTFLASFAFNF